jgi:nicotinamidase-related amidase
MLHKNQSILVVVDVQSKLLPSIHEADETVGQICRLVRGFRIVGAPVLVTEQYRKGLGETDARIQAAVTEKDPTTGQEHRFTPIEKMYFSCVLDDPFRAALEATGRRQVILCGIESHVCIYQTAVHLIERGYHVEVAADAISSRSPYNKKIALKRLAAEGAKLTCVEMAVFEMLEMCGTDPFKQWVKAIR